MVPIREALLSIVGENATAIQPIVAALSGLGFNEHEQAAAFRLLVLLVLLVLLLLTLTAGQLVRLARAGELVGSGSRHFPRAFARLKLAIECGWT